MPSRPYLTRSAAAKAARREGHTQFRTRRHAIDRQYWQYDTITAGTVDPDAKGWAATKEYVAWLEADYRDAGRIPGVDAVLIVTCRMDEIDAEDLKFIESKGWLIQPVTPELFEIASKSPRSSTTGGATPSPRPEYQRAKSDVESPVKIVWATADAMPGASRNEVVAACVAKGVNESTAKTQYYKWAKAKQG